MERCLEFKFSKEYIQESKGKILKDVLYSLLFIVLFLKMVLTRGMGIILGIILVLGIIAIIGNIYEILKNTNLSKINYVEIKDDKIYIKESFINKVKQLEIANIKKCKVENKIITIISKNNQVYKIFLEKINSEDEKDLIEILNKSNIN